MASPRKVSLKRRRPRREPAHAGQAPPFTAASAAAAARADETVDLQRRRDQLTARVAELQFDLGGLVYEMAIRNQIRVDVLVKRAAVLQDADSELAEVNRIMRLEQTSTAGECGNCGAPHSSGAGYCWQCGQPLLAEVSTDRIGSGDHRIGSGDGEAPTRTLS